MSGRASAWASPQYCAILSKLNPTLLRYSNCSSKMMCPTPAPNSGKSVLSFQHKGLQDSDTAPVWY